MQTFSIKSHKQHERTLISGLIAFATITLLHNLGDAVMSYTSPNFIENIVENPFYMGLIVSTSSIVGLVCDFLFSNVLKEKSFYTYLIGAIIVASFFPLILLFEASIPFVLLAMAVWGIYYELIMFAKSNYIHHFLPHDQHDTGWAYLTAFTSLAYLLGPTIAVTLGFMNDRLPLITALVFQMVALVSAFFFKIAFRHQIRDPLAHEQHTSHFLKGFAIWGVLNKRLWPVLMFMFCLMLIDSTFWTVGAILVDELKDTHRFASMLYVVYLLPFLFMGPLGIKLSKYIGKKRTAYLTGSAGGILFSLTYFMGDFSSFMALMALASLMLAIATPEIHGAVEDYCERLGENSNSLVGLTSSMGSLAYIIGPILSGAIASVVGEQQTFAVMGLMLFVISVVTLIATPRKIRLPQTQLHQIADVCYP